MVTISDVIAETGMSQGAIYRFYNGLDEILADMLTKMRSEYNIINSFGGATAYALCQNDPEFVCGINIDGLLIGDHVGKVLKTPFLQISCENNATLETRTYLDHTKPVFKVLFRDMEHLGFSDLKFAIPIKKVVGALPPDVLHENICRCYLEFFDTYLKRVKDCPELTNSDAVTVTEYQPDIRDHEKESDHSQLLRCNFPDLQD